MNRDHPGVRPAPVTNSVFRGNYNISVLYMMIDALSTPPFIVRGKTVVLIDVRS